MAGVLGSLAASCSCHSTSSTRSQQDLVTRRAAFQPHRSISIGLPKSTQRRRKARCSSTVQIRAQQPMLAPRWGSEDVGQQGHSPACKLPRSIDAMGLSKSTDGPFGPILIISPTCRTQDMAGDPFGLLLRQRIIFLGGEASFVA